MRIQRHGFVYVLLSAGAYLCTEADIATCIVEGFF